MVSSNHFTPLWVTIFLSQFEVKRILKICLQLFGEWLKFPRLLDNLSFQGMENLQVNVVQ